MKIKREWLEYGMLLLTLALLLWLGPGQIWAHQIDHGYPYAYNAADTFQHQGRAAGILHVGDYQYEPMERVSGFFAEFPGYYPPTVSQLGALWAAFPRLDTYLTTPALIFLSTIISAALIYFIIRRFNKIVALLSLPLFLYMFSTPVAMRYFTWGHWPGIFGQLFIIMLAWVVLERDMPGWILFIIIALTGAFMAYTSYVIPTAILIIALLALLLWKGELKLKRILKLAIAAIVFLIIVSRFALIFVNVWSPLMEQQTVLTDWPGGGGAPQFAELGAIRYLIILGVILSIVILGQQFLKKKITQPLVILFGLLMLGLGYANAIGFHKRAFFVRLYWPIYLSLFLGLILYYGGKMLLQQSGMKWNTTIATAVTLILILTITLTIEKPDAGQGSLNQQLWDGITWLRDETPPDTTFAIMYGDVFVGDIFLNLQRHHFLIEKDEYYELIQNNSVRRHMYSTIGTNWYPWAVVPEDLSKENPIIWNWEYDFNLIEGNLWKDRDICDWDYVLFTKQSYQPILVQYGLYIANIMTENEWINIAYQNDLVVILHNTQKGDACIEDHDLQQG